MAGWSLVVSPPGATLGGMIMDNSGPYLYLASNDGPGSPIVRKINRNTRITEATGSLSKTPYYTDAYLIQDNANIYIGHQENGGYDGGTPITGFMKIRKSDLVELGRVDYDSSTILSPTHPDEQMMGMRMGRGWNSGKIWMLTTESSAYFGSSHLTSWDSSSLAQVDSVLLTYDNPPSSVLGSTQPILNPTTFSIHSSGDIYIAGMYPMDTLGGGSGQINECRISKVDSGLTLSTFKDFPAYPGAGYIRGTVSLREDGLFWDDDLGALIYWVNFNHPNVGTHSSGYVKMHSSGSVLVTRDFSEDNVRNHFLDYSTKGNVNGLPSYLLITGDLNNTSTGDTDILVVDPNTLSTRNSVSIPAGVNNASDVRADPEGRVWLTIRDLYLGENFHLFIYDGTFGGVSGVNEKIWARGTAVGLARGFA